MRLTSFGVAIFLMLTAASLVRADPIEDADYISTQFAQANDLWQIIEENNNRHAYSIGEALKGVEAFILDSDAFEERLFNDYGELVYGAVQRAYSLALLEVLTEQEIAVLADFYRSQNGQELIATGRMISTKGEAVSAFFVLGQGGQLAPVVREMERRKFEFVEFGINDVPSPLTMEKLIPIVADPTIVYFANDAARQAALDMMRK